MQQRRAIVVRKLVETRAVVDGTEFTIKVFTSANRRAKVETWLNENPDRRLATWQNSFPNPLIWKVDRSAYTPTGLAHLIVREATGESLPIRGPRWWKDPNGQTLLQLAERLLTEDKLPPSRSSAT
jgi:hypothetical protein